MFDAAISLNRDIDTFKGIGKLRITRTGKTRSVRAAWIGQFPDRIRIDLLVAGQPVLQLSSDGSWFYYRNPGDPENGYHRITAGDDTFEEIFGVPLKATEILSILGCRIPFRKVGSALSLASADDDSQRVLELQRPWLGTSGQIQFNRQLDQIQQVTLYDLEQQPAVRIDYDAWAQQDGYRLCRRIQASSPDGGKLEIRIDRYVPNPSLSPDVFILSRQVHNR